MSYFQNHGSKTPYLDFPGSLISESFEMGDVRHTIQTRASTAPHITPYLGLRARLSQIWINRWTVLLLLVLVRVILLEGQLYENVGRAKEKALSACTKVEDVGSAMASMPHYLSLGVNDMAAGGIEAAVDAMVVMLDLILQGVEGMIFFFISFLTSTYTCLLTALIHGTLGAVASVAEDATEAFNKVIDDAADAIKEISGGLEDAINKITGGIEDSIFGDVIPDIPTVDFSGPIDKLKKFDLNSDDFVEDVRKLSNDVPTFEEVQNMTKEAISIPFDMVRKAINDSYGGYKFDRDVFPLAQKEELTFCSDNNTLSNFFQGLYDLIVKSKIIFIVLISLLAVGVMAPMAWLEIKRWRKQQTFARLVGNQELDPMDVVYTTSRPTTAVWGIKLVSRFSGKQQLLWRWCWAYATSPPALFVLSLAVAGFFSCMCQAILLQAVKNEVPALTQQVGEFADNVVSSINGVSERWAGDANAVIGGLNDEINNNVLGYVTNATDSVNNTLTAFMDHMDEGLVSVFNNTILLDPIKTVVRCVIGIKVESVQKGLTWVHNHAKITLPRFSNDTFSMGAKNSINGDSKLNTFLASPSSVTTDEVSGAVSKVTEWLHKSIIEEAFISTGLLLVYVIVVLMGVGRTLAAMAMRGKGRADSGMRYIGNEQLHPGSLSKGPTYESRDHQNQYGHMVNISGGSGYSGAEGGSCFEKVSTGEHIARPRQTAHGHSKGSSYGGFDESF